MKKNGVIKCILFLVIVIISNIFVLNYCSIQNNYIKLEYKVSSNERAPYQLFYMLDDEWTGENSQTIYYDENNKEKILKYSVPINSKVLRFDFGDKEADVTISLVQLKYYFKKINLDYNVFLDKSNYNEISSINIDDSGNLKIKTSGNDPYIVYKINDDVIKQFVEYKNNLNIFVKVILLILIDLLLIIMFRKTNSIVLLLQELNFNKKLIWSLSKNDFKTKYAGSYLGMIWAFVQPVVTIMLYWFVFGYGLRAGAPVPNVPFVVWFITGLIPWFFFQEALMNATNCMLEYSYLVKKVVFKISILPLVKVISSVFVHIAFVCFLIVVSTFNGIPPTKYIIQILYYSFCTFCFVLTISYATSAIIVFFRDLGQIINIILQIGMWMTPIMWSYTIMPDKYQWILKLNPMFYIVEGYRDTLIYKVWFFQRYFQTIYFWMFILFIFSISSVMFKKLKPHFADVL